jgi:hypothetical protein
MPDPGYDAGFPPTAKCMECHRSIKKDSPPIQKLALFQEEDRPVPWVQVYQIPDYLDFSHKVHLAKATVTCETCDSPVRDRDVIRRETDISMGWSIDCHRTNNAPVACNVCHDPRLKKSEDFPNLKSVMRLDLG